MAYFLLEIKAFSQQKKLDSFNILKFKELRKRGLISLFNLKNVKTKSILLKGVIFSVLNVVFWISKSGCGKNTRKFVTFSFKNLTI